MYHANTNQKKAGLITLVSEKTDLRARILRGTLLHNGKEVNSSQRQFLRYVILTQDASKHEAKSDRTARRNRQIHLYTWRLPHTSISK